MVVNNTLEKPPPEPLKSLFMSTFIITCNYFHLKYTIFHILHLSDTLDNKKLNLYI